MTVEESPPFGAHLIDATTVAVSGEIDVYSAPDLTALLADPIVERVIMTAVSFIDAAGLADTARGAPIPATRLDLVLTEPVRAATA